MERGDMGKGLKRGERGRVHTAILLITSVSTVIIMVTDIALRNALPIATLEPARAAVLC